MIERDFPLSIEDFIVWLKAKDENERVGWQNGCKYCPIFNCLRDRKEDVYSVDIEYTHFLGKLGSVDNPLWIQKFIRKQDFPLKPGEMNVSISAKEALKVLQEVEQECT